MTGHRFPSVSHSSSIRRRANALNADAFTTYEEIERSDLRVVKRDRTHEPFDRRKLAGALPKLSRNAHQLLTLEQLVDEIVHDWNGDREVNPPLLGQRSSKKLRGIDESRISVTPRSIVASKMSINSSTPSRAGKARS